MKTHEGDAPGKETVDTALVGLKELRQLLAKTATALSELHADELALAQRRSRVLAEACDVLGRAIGEAGRAPPPVPKLAVPPPILSLKPVLDISEVAELIESLRPPAPDDEP